jgi:hypothetical protein
MIKVNVTYALSGLEIASRCNAPDCPHCYINGVEGVCSLVESIFTSEGDEVRAELTSQARELCLELSDELHPLDPGSFQATCTKLGELLTELCTTDSMTARRLCGMSIELLWHLGANKAELKELVRQLLAFIREQDSQVDPDPDALVVSI